MSSNALSATFLRDPYVGDKEFFSYILDLVWRKLCSVTLLASAPFLARKDFIRLVFWRTRQGELVPFLFFSQCTLTASAILEVLWLSGSASTGATGQGLADSSSGSGLSRIVYMSVTFSHSFISDNLASVSLAYPFYFLLNSQLIQNLTRKGQAFSIPHWFTKAVFIFRILSP
jgi:hypothetical protein